jgi:hypothetical protein
MTVRIKPVIIKRKNIMTQDEIIERIALMEMRIHAMLREITQLRVQIDNNREDLLNTAPRAPQRSPLDDNPMEEDRGFDGRPPDLLLPPPPQLPFTPPPFFFRVPVAPNIEEENYTVEPNTPPQ